MLPFVIDITYDEIKKEFIHNDIHSHHLYNKSSTELINIAKNKYRSYKYITILSNGECLPKGVYIDDIKVDFTIMINGVVHGEIHILHNHIKYILTGDEINPYDCISCEIICPDVEERVDYLKDNGMFTDLKKFICNKN